MLGVDKDHPAATVKVYAPASGYIIAQNVTNAAAAGVTYAGSANAFTIADLSHVWIICDVYENDLPTVHLGQKADIRLTAYPDRVLTGVISDIGAVLDPQIRTAKVRIQVDNPRHPDARRNVCHGDHPRQDPRRPTRRFPPRRCFICMTATGSTSPRATASSAASPVQGGDILPGNMQEILSGINAGQQVVSNALALQNTADQ